MFKCLPNIDEKSQTMASFSTFLNRKAGTVAPLGSYFRPNPAPNRPQPTKIAFRTGSARGRHLDQCLSSGRVFLRSLQEGGRRKDPWYIHNKTSGSVSCQQNAGSSTRSEKWSCNFKLEPGRITTYGLLHLLYCFGLCGLGMLCCRDVGKQAFYSSLASWWFNHPVERLETKWIKNHSCLETNYIPGHTIELEILCILLYIHKYISGSYRSLWERHRSREKHEMTQLVEVTIPLQ